MAYRRDSDIGKEVLLTDDLIATIRKDLGRERECRQYNEEAGKDQIRHFAEGAGDDNPLWMDEEYAAKTRWGRIIAPPTFPLTCITGGIWHIERSGGSGWMRARPIHGGMDWEFFLPIYVGDKIKATYKLADVFSKYASEGGANWFFIHEHKFVNQHGDTVAKLNRIFIRKTGVRRYTESRYANYKKAKYTAEEIEAIQGDYEKMELRGAEPRYWEDVAVGDNLPQVVKGPTSITSEMAWTMAHGGPFVMAHQIAHKYMRRHPMAATLDEETNIPDFGERHHWIDSVGQAHGFPAAFDIGYERDAWLAQVLTNWMGDDGFVRQLSVQNRLLNFLGDTSWCRGEVVDKYVKEGRHLVKVSLWVVNQRGDRHTEGWGEVELPTRA